jgi:hypothetical protein
MFIHYYYHYHYYFNVYCNIIILFPKVMGGHIPNHEKEMEFRELPTWAGLRCYSVPFYV